MTRLGLIIPSSNTTMEMEFHKMLPKGFSLHTARVRLQMVTKKQLVSMEKEIEKEAIKLADADVEVIGYGCTTGSLFRGLGHDRMIEEKIRKVSGIPAVATAGAVVTALKALNIKKVALATPYIDEINKLEEKFLLENGFQIVDLKSLEIMDNVKIGKLSSEDAYNLVMKLRHDEADGVFISCTNFPTSVQIERLNKEIGKPVISSNTATLWALLRNCGLSIRICGFRIIREEGS